MRAIGLTHTQKHEIIKKEKKEEEKKNWNKLKQKMKLWYINGGWALMLTLFFISMNVIDFPFFCYFSFLLPLLFLTNEFNSFCPLYMEFTEKKNPKTKRKIPSHSNHNTKALLYIYRYIFRYIFPRKQIKMEIFLFGHGKFRFQ